MRKITNYFGWTELNFEYEYSNYASHKWKKIIDCGSVWYLECSECLDRCVVSSWLPKLGSNTICFSKIITNCKIEASKKEFRVYFKNGPLTDCWISFRNELINLPFRPWVLHIYDRKLWSDEEYYNNIYKKYQAYYE